jgi:hypothetical protein
MERQEVFDVITSERNYQIEMTANNDRPDMIDDLHVGDTLTAMRVILNQAENEWYSGSVPHSNAMEYIRKIAGLSVQLGEKYGMPYRERY